MPITLELSLWHTLILINFTCESLWPVLWLHFLDTYFMSMDIINPLYSTLSTIYKCYGQCVKTQHKLK